MASLSGVTAIIPTYNRGAFLKEALSSLLAQTLPPEEIIVVDDGSVDDTAQVVASFVFPVVYIRQLNKGKSSALNTGLQRASNELIYILDDDDIAVNDAIERLVAGLKTSPECGFAYAGHNAFRVSASGEVLTEPRESHPPDDDALSLVLMRRCLLFQSNMLVRRKCYEQVGAFNEEFIRTQDYEMLLRLVRRFRGKRVDGIVFSQRQHSGVRGSAALRIKEQDNSGVWHLYNQRIFRSIYSTYDLREFLPGNHAVLTDQDQISALLERCVVVGRRQLWKLAAQDLREIGIVAGKSQIRSLTHEQSGILHRMFDASSSSLWDFANAAEFRAALSEIPDPILSKHIRAALGVPFVGHIRNSVKRNELKSIVYLLACLLYFAPSGGRLVRYSGDFALILINRKGRAKAASAASIPFRLITKSGSVSAQSEMGRSNLI